MDSGMTALDYVRGLEWWQVLQPETRRLNLTVTEPPRLHDLTWLPYPRRDDADRILQGYTGDRSFEQFTDEGERGFLLVTTFSEPPRTTDSQVRTWRVEDCQIPTEPQNVPHVATDVIPRPLAVEKIAGPRIEPASGEGIPNHATELAPD